MMIQKTVFQTVEMIIEMYLGRNRPKTVASHGQRTLQVRSVDLRDDEAGAGEVDSHGPQV